MVGELFNKKKDPAPFKYRMEFYKRTEELGKKIVDEKSAILFLLRFNKAYSITDDVAEIFNYDSLVRYEQKALKILESQEKNLVRNLSYKDIVYGYRKLIGLANLKVKF